MDSPIIGLQFILTNGFEILSRLENTAYILISKFESIPENDCMLDTCQFGYKEASKISGNFDLSTKWNNSNLVLYTWYNLYGYIIWIYFPSVEYEFENSENKKKIIELKCGPQFFHQDPEW